MEGGPDQKSEHCCFAAVAALMTLGDSLCLQEEEKLALRSASSRPRASVSPSIEMQGTAPPPSA